jgi:hypothetical protein
MQTPLFPPNAEADGIPSFEQTLAALGPVPNLLYRAIEFGANQNRAYSDMLCDRETPQSHIREMIVRHQVKRYLEKYRINVEEDRLNVGNEPLMGLFFRFRVYQIRILKGPNGEIPGCGVSKNRRRFYSQWPGFYLDASRRGRKTKLNLILLWDFDPSFNLGQLWLACPQQGGRTASDVLCYWRELIPYPASIISTPAKTNGVEAGDEQLERLLRGDEYQDEEGEEPKEA